MNFDYFLNYLQSWVSLDEECKTALKARVKEIAVIKGTNLLFPGDLCKHIYFIRTGFFRVYTTDGYEDCTIDFATTNHFVTSIDGFFSQKIVNEGITCEENSIVFRISYYDWLALEDFSPQFLSLSKRILQEHLLRLNIEKNVYRLGNATKKYIYLGEKYPGIANVVSQKHIASYLGITGPTLSNLLKNIFHKCNKMS
jgi:CRP-like cAMP-binding protein